MATAAFAQLAAYTSHAVQATDDAAAFLDVFETLCLAPEELQAPTDAEAQAVGYPTAAALEADHDGMSGHGVEIRQLVRALPEEERVALCQLVEVCPMHRCDEQICADDEVAECAAVRA